MAVTTKIYYYEKIPPLWEAGPYRMFSLTLNHSAHGYPLHLIAKVKVKVIKVCTEEILHLVSLCVYHDLWSLCCHKISNYLQTVQPFLTFFSRNAQFSFNMQVNTFFFYNFDGEIRT